MASNKVSTDKITGFLSKPRTAAEVAEKFSVTPATARKYLDELVSNGAATTSGTRATGTRGRPATLYTA